MGIGSFSLFEMIELILGLCQEIAREQGYDFRVATRELDGPGAGHTEVQIGNKVFEITIKERAA